jgi:hypothetical protein
MRAMFPIFSALVVEGFEPCLNVPAVRHLILSELDRVGGLYSRNCVAITVLQIEIETGRRLILVADFQRETLTQKIVDSHDLCIARAIWAGEGKGV